MEVYLVGGAVRDKLLGLPVEERDWVVVGASAEQMLADGFVQRDADFPVFIHPKTGEEYALARVERKTGPGHKGFAIDASPDIELSADLQRRDFTVNAIAEAPDGSLVDPFGGLADLDRRRLRHVSEAFVEDPLRVFRGARFMAKLAHLGFSLTDPTMRLMQSMTTRRRDFSSLSAERLWSETEKALQERSPHRYFQTLQECGAVAVICPDFAQAVDAVFDAGGPPLGVRHDGGARTDTFARPGLRMAVIALRATAGVPTPERRRVITALYRCFGAPRSHETLAVLAATLCEALPCELWQLDAHKAMDLLELVDAFRRSDRFAELMHVCSAAADGGAIKAICDRLSTAQGAARNVNAAGLRAQGLDGKAIGEALRRLRLEAIRDSLAADA